MQSVAAQAAKAVQASFNAAQAARSPSRLWAEAGRFSGQGWEEGFSTSMKRAQLRAGDIARQTVGVARGIDSINIGANERPSAMNDTDIGGMDISRPIVLNVDGKTLAAVQAENARAAGNARMRRLALGVGK
jgi:hypothetical protein